MNSDLKIIVDQAINEASENRLEFLETLRHLLSFPEVRVSNEAAYVALRGVEDEFSFLPPLPARIAWDADVKERLEEEGRELLLQNSAIAIAALLRLRSTNEG